MTSRIVVLSDTHLATGVALPDPLVADITSADMVIHLGDFTGEDLADFLEATGKLVAVYGNCDGLEIRRRFPSRRDLAVGDKTIRCIHGDIGARTAHAAALAEDGADVVLYGHSHMPRIEQEGNTLLFNPGSPTQKRFAAYRSYGILDIDDRIEARIVPLEGTR